MPWQISAKRRSTNSKSCRLRPSNMILDQFPAYNIEILQTEEKNPKKIVLAGVPCFLVEAFEWLEARKASEVEGIFRREGNSNRMKNAWQIFYGILPIPDEWTVHDVCSLIKRFFREMKTCLFGESQEKILSFAESIKEERTLVESLLILIERLPGPNVATIAFLTRQLHKISSSTVTNQMTVSNLATVFAPSIFHDTTTSSSSNVWANNNNEGRRFARSMHKFGKRVNSQDNLLDFVKSRNNLQVLVLKLLIQYSNHISARVEIPPSKVSVNRKNSDILLPRQKSPIAGATSTPPSQRKQYCSRLVSPVKVCPRSSSVPFNRTRAILSNIPLMGKNGSFAPNESKNIAQGELDDEGVSSGFCSSNSNGLLQRLFK